MLEHKKELETETQKKYEVKPRVEIIIGVYKKGSNEKISVDSCSVFALYIDNLRTKSTRYFYIDRTVLEHCKEVAHDYAEFMLANELDSYSLENGEMSDHSHPEKERLKCSPIPIEEVEIFRKTLDSMLGR